MTYRLRRLLLACVTVALMLATPALDARAVTLQPLLTDTAADVSWIWQNTSDQGAVVILHVAVAGTGTVQVRVQVENTLDGSWRDLAAFSAVSAPGVSIYYVDPRPSSTPSGAVTEVVQRTLPQARIRLLVDKSDGSQWTFGVLRYRLE